MLCCPKIENDNTDSCLHYQITSSVILNQLHAERVCTSYFVSTVLWEEITAGSRRKSRVTAAPQNGFFRLLSVFAFMLVDIQGLKSHNRHRVCTRRERERERMCFFVRKHFSQLMSLM